MCGGCKASPHTSPFCRLRKNQRFNLRFWVSSSSEEEFSLSLPSLGSSENVTICMILIYNVMCHFQLLFVSKDVPFLEMFSVT